MPTSEALLPRSSSRHPYLLPHSRLIPYCGPAARGPHEETSDRWWTAIRRRLHCGRFSGIQYCGLWFNIRRAPPTMPPTDAKSGSERPLQRSDCHYVPLPILLCAGLTDADGFDQNCLNRARRKARSPRQGHLEIIAWRASEAETNKVICSDRWG